MVTNSALQLSPAVVLASRKCVFLSRDRRTRIDDQRQKSYEKLKNFFPPLNTSSIGYHTNGIKNFQNTQTTDCSINHPIVKERRNYISEEKKKEKI